MTVHTCAHSTLEVLARESLKIHVQTELQSETSCTKKNKPSQIIKQNTVNNIIIKYKDNYNMMTFNNFSSISSKSNFLAFLVLDLGKLACLNSQCLHWLLI